MSERVKAANEHVAAGFFALRTPLLSFDELCAWSADLTAPRATDALKDAIAADRCAIRQRLRGAVDRPEVREALFLASPSLDERLATWLRDPESESGQKVELSLFRYLTRMAARPTPFGLFAGCAVGEIGQATHLFVPPRAECRRRSRLDMDFLFALADAIVRDPATRARLIYRPNSTLYRAAGRVRLAVGRLDGKQRSYDLISVEPTSYLDATLMRAEAGATLDALASALAEQGFDRAEADEYVRDLVDSQILVSDVSPAVTGPESTAELCDKLAGYPETAAIADRLGAAARALKEIDEAGVGVEPDRFRAIAAGLSGLPAEPELPRLFQVDLVKPSAGTTLGPEIVRELVRGIAVLRRMAPEKDRLRAFAEAFAVRFGDEEVSLLEALDEESGCGFEASLSPAATGEPLVAGLHFSEASANDSWTSRDTYLLRLAQRAQLRGARSIELAAEDVEAMASRRPLPLPDAFAVVATIVAETEEAVARSDFRIVLNGASGPAGANLLGRFCDADPALRAWVERHLRAEEKRSPGAVFAEIVHLPEGRIGNVIQRPVLRDYEIPFLGRSGAPPERCLPASDLVLQLVDEHMVLRSRRLNRQVIPRLATAHYHASSRNLSVYRFLTAMQNQALAPGLGFSWGPLENASFLPRITVGRLVLSRARWLLTSKDLAPLGARDAAARYRAAQDLRKELALPRWVAIADDDNELPIDLDNALAVETLASLVKDRHEARLVEVLGFDALVASGPEGRFTHEIVVPFDRANHKGVDEPKAAGTIAAGTVRPTRSDRVFPLGSSWLFAKLYAGPATLDRVLCQVAVPVVERALASGAADTWFFMRYADPDWHLRVRLHGKPTQLMAEVLPDLLREAQPWIDEGTVTKVAFDTYQREVERYGGAFGIGFAESIFQADSDATARILSLLLGSEGAADARWRLAIAGIDRLLGDLGFALAEKHAVVSLARDDFLERFQADTLLRRQLGERYRKERSWLEPILDPAKDDESPLAPGLDVLRERSRRIAPIAANLRGLERDGRLSRSLIDTGSSYIHMFTNRLFRGAALAQELVVYDLLERMYASRRARGSKA
jgi:thiopeptide-type bacteriocin biosynthesis protein